MIFLGGWATHGTGKDYSDLETTLSALIMGDRIAGVGMMMYAAAAVLAILTVHSLNRHQENTIDNTLQAQVEHP